MTKRMKTTVLSFREGTFYFYPHKVKDGRVQVFNNHNLPVGYATVKQGNDVFNAVHAWLIAQRIVRA